MCALRQAAALSVRASSCAVQQDDFLPSSTAAEGDMAKQYAEVLRPLLASRLYVLLPVCLQHH
jgi:hypothetical protein